MNLFNNIISMFNKIIPIFNYIFYISSYFLKNIGDNLFYYNYNYNLFLYLLVSFFIIIFIYVLYVKIKLGFWASCPINSRYYIPYFNKNKNKDKNINNKLIINNNLPLIDKYCDFSNVKTILFSNIDESIQSNELKNLNQIKDLSPNSSYLSIYYKIIKQFNKEINIFESTNIIDDTIISIPINFTYHNKTYNCYYILDFYIPNSKNYTKNNSKQFNKELFKTHIYNICNERKKHEIFLFKSYENIYCLKYFAEISLYKIVLNNKIKDNNVKLYYTFLEINKQNINLLITFINENRKLLESLIIMNLHDILNLIEKREMNIYALYFNDKIKSVYIYKKENNIHTLISSVNNCDNNIFYYGFLKSLEKIQKINKNYNMEIIIYDVIHSNIIIESFKKVNIVYYFSKLYYYIYNFNYDNIKSNILLLC